MSHPPLGSNALEELLQASPEELEKRAKNVIMPSPDKIQRERRTVEAFLQKPTAKMPRQTWVERWHPFSWLTSPKVWSFGATLLFLLLFIKPPFLLPSKPIPTTLKTSLSSKKHPKKQSHSTKSFRIPAHPPKPRLRRKGMAFVNRIPQQQETIILHPGLLEFTPSGNMKNPKVKRAEHMQAISEKTAVLFAFQLKEEPGYFYLWKIYRGRAELLYPAKSEIKHPKYWSIGDAVLSSNGHTLMYTPEKSEQGIITFLGAKTQRVLSAEFLSAVKEWKHIGHWLKNQHSDGNRWYDSFSLRIRRKHQTKEQR